MHTDKGSLIESGTQRLEYERATALRREDIEHGALAWTPEGAQFFPYGDEGSAEEQYFKCLRSLPSPSTMAEREAAECYFLVDKLRTAF